MDVWVQPDSTAVYNLEQRIREAVSDADFLSSVRKGDKCLAAYGRDWYRATVLYIEAVGTYMVRYVDYGNCEAVPLQKLRAVPDSLNTKPLVVRCALEGVVENAISLEQCQIALFHKTLTVKVVMKTDQHLFVRMTASDGTDVNTSLGLLSNLICCCY